MKQIGRKRGFSFKVSTWKRTHGTNVSCWVYGGLCLFPLFTCFHSFWVFIAAWAISSYSEWELGRRHVHRLLVAEASLVAELGAWGTWLRQSRPVGSVAGAPGL